MLEVLISTMNLEKEDFSLFKSMNIQTNATICNQSNFDGFEKTNDKFEWRIFSNKKIGVGRSRNNLILQANGEICLLADDDMVFHEGYDEVVNKVFTRIPTADVIIFNIDDGGIRFKTKKDTKVNKFTFTRYGAARIAFRKNSIYYNNIMFNVNFGGGGIYGSGEDTLFLNDCIYRNLNIYAVSETVAKLNDERESTWFSGYNEKYWSDKGALFAAMNRRFILLNLLQYSFRKYKLANGELDFFEVFNLMNEGAKKYNRSLKRGFNNG